MSLSENWYRNESSVDGIRKLQRSGEAFRAHLHGRGHDVYLFDAATEIDGADVAIELDAKRAIDQRSGLAAGLT